MTKPRRLPPGIREHHGKFQVRYYSPDDGREKTKSFDRLTDAKNYKQAIETDKRRGEWLDPRGQQTAFDSWATDYFASKLNLRDSTRASEGSYLRTHVVPHFSVKPIGRIRPLDVQGWVNGLSAKGLAPKTVRECYRLFSSIMQAAVTARLIASSPCAGITLPRVERQEQRFLSADQIATLAREVDPHYQALVLTAAYTGMRWGELAGLRRENLDLLRRRLQVVGTVEEISGKVRYLHEVKTKSSRRTITLPRFLVDVLAAHLAGVNGDFVFTNKSGGLLRRSSFRGSVWLPALKRAGLQGVRFHDLRHSHAALLIAQGAHPKSLQGRLGHSSITTSLDRYGHLYADLDERLSDRLDDVFAEAVREPNADQVRTSGDSGVVSTIGVSRSRSA